MFRYRDAHGIEKRLVNEAELLHAINDGRVTATTPLRPEVGGDWAMAGRHPVFKLSGKKGLSRAHGAGRGIGGIARRLLALVPRTRARWIALVAVVLVAAGLVTANILHKRRLAEKKLTYASAMLGFAEGRMPAPEVLNEPAPESKDPELRTLWVRLQVAHTISQSMESAQSAFGIRGFHPPEGWLSDAYVMDARAHAAVGAHWAGYLAWDRQWSPGASRLLNRENARRAAEAQLTERQTFELIDPAQPGLSAVGWDLELRRQFAEEAGRLHTTLVESRGNAFISDGAWWFSDTRTQRAYARHAQNLRRIGELLRANAATRAAALGVEPGDGAVPAGLAGMRNAGG